MIELVRISSIIEAISVALVVPASLLSLIVLSHWMPKSFVPFSHKRKRTGEEWLLLGITIGFSAFLLNSLFWGAHFLFDYLSLDDLTRKTYEAGPAVNIFTRNIPYTFSAICHLIGFSKYSNKKSALGWQIFISMLSLIAALSTLLYFST